jgi:zinc protease
VIKQLEIDGIPALIAPARGPMRAGLAFRVGIADESLSRRGITHLIEHLALHSFVASDYHYNGATSMEYTYFHLQGSAGEITGFLNGVCAALCALPMHRVAAEKAILRTEAAGIRNGPATLLPIWRHGARDFGLSSYPEWGLSAITEHDLYAWTARYFTRENAALWIAGDEVPPGLQLVLPSGVRQRPPVPTSALPRTPTYTCASSAAVVWDAEVRRHPSAAVFASVLERRLFRELRQDAGLSYAPRTQYEPRAGGTAVVTAAVDALPENRMAVLGGVVDVLAAMEAGRIAADEVTVVVEQACLDLAQAEEEGARLPGQAMALLSGRPVQSLDEAWANLRAVTRDQVVAVAAAAYEAGLLVTPAGADAEWAGYAQVPADSAGVVTGTSYPARMATATKLVVGADGVSVTGPDGTVTVRFDECAAMLVWADGGRRLIGVDGTAVAVEPTHFRGGRSAIAELPLRVPEHIRVPLPAREAGQIPSPPRGSAAPRVWTARWWRETAASVLRIREAGPEEIVGLIATPMFALLTIGALTGSVTDGWGSAVGLAAFLGVVTLGAYLCARPHLRRTRGW